MPWHRLLWDGSWLQCDPVPVAPEIHAPPCLSSWVPGRRQLASGSSGIHPLVYLGRRCPPSPGTSRAGPAAPPLLSLEIGDWRVENKALCSLAPSRAARQGLLLPPCPRPCHHGSGSAPHNLDGCFISMATFLLKLFRGSLVLFHNEGSRIPHSVPCKRLRETTLTHLPTSFPLWQAVPALVQRAAGLVPAASLLPALLSLPSASLSPLLSSAPFLPAAC